MTPSGARLGTTVSRLGGRGDLRNPEEGRDSKEQDAR